MENVLITGATGLIGTHLRQKLSEEGYHVRILTRQKSRIEPGSVYYWDPDAGYIDAEAVENADYIIHLAGTNIGNKRWTPKRRSSIADSRIRTARLLFDAEQKARKKARAFISASATGFYGAMTSEIIYNESNPPGSDFLATTCREWENEALSFASLGIRTVILRNGVVLSADGGIIKRLKFPFKMGFGAVLGTGNQFLPWIHMEDLTAIYTMAVKSASLSGIYNAVSPQYSTFRDFAGELASAMNRRIWLPRIPSVLLKIMLGRMSSMILEGSRISSEKIVRAGYLFRFPDLKSALENLIRAI